MYTYVFVYTRKILYFMDIAITQKVLHSDCLLLIKTCNVVIFLCICTRRVYNMENFLVSP